MTIVPDDDAAATFVQLALRCTQGRIIALKAAAALNLPDCWIAAGAIRNAVWDFRHGYTVPTPLNDIDVIWFDHERASAERDRDLTQTLCNADPSIRWSVKNQARMHHGHGHAPYRDCMDAMGHWPETATGVAARILPNDTILVQSPFSLGDLVNMVLRPGPDFATLKRKLFAGRTESKQWLSRWPSLTVAE